MKDRNSISIWKVIFSLCILGEHSGITHGWITPCEFFYLVSGFFLAYEVQKKGTEESLFAYTKKRVIRLYPMYFWAMLLYGIFFFGINAPKDITGIHVMGYIFKNTLACYRQFLMLHVFGEQQIILLNPPCWFAAATFWSSIILFAILKYLPQKLSNFILFVFSGGVMLFYFITEPSLDLWQLHRTIGIGNINFVVSDAMMRALADMGIGILLFRTNRCLQKRNHNVPGFLLKLAEILLYSTVIILGYLHGDTKWDFVLLLMLCVCVILSFGKGNIPFANGRLIKALEKKSYGLYLNQCVFLAVLFPGISYLDSPVKKFFVAFVCTLCLTMICEWMIEKVSGVFKRV